MTDPARILVVDDTAANVKLLADVLTARGYAVTTAASGKEALDKVATAAKGETMITTAVEWTSERLRELLAT